MRARQDLNYLCKLQNDGLAEIALGIAPENRIHSFRETKNPEQQQAAKDKLLQLLQEPPIRKFDESDEEYIARYLERDIEAQSYERLMYYIK
jgi:hypothetical protein